MLSDVRYRHVLIVEDDQGRRDFLLEADFYSIGRDPNCDIRLISQFVSRRYATVVQLPNEDGSFYHRIVDGNARGKVSASGLLINGHQLQACNLQHEDEIIFGSNVTAMYLLLRDGDRPSSGDEPSAPIGRGGRGGGNPNDSEMASPDDYVLN